MSEAQLKKIEDECAKLESELLRMNNAMDTAKACEEMLKFILENEEPLHPDSTVSDAMNDTIPV